MDIPRPEFVDVSVLGNESFKTGWKYSFHLIGWYLKF